MSETNILAAVTLVTVFTNWSCPQSRIGTFIDNHGVQYSVQQGFVQTNEVTRIMHTDGTVTDRTNRVSFGPPCLEKKLFAVGAQFDTTNLALHFHLPTKPPVAPPPLPGVAARQ